MKQTARLLGVLALVLAVASLSAGEQTTLNGSFVWNMQNRTGDLQAIFTETEAGKWSVDFHFLWEERPHVYSGTAEGSLTHGDLKGSILNETKERRFEFSGTFEDGIFKGTHAALGEDGEAEDTGTLTLQ